MKTATIIDVIAAAHWTYKLSGVPVEFSQRGGIMLVAPPEQFKTQFVSMMEDYPRTLVLSDLTTRELTDFHQELGGSYKSLAFTAFEKIYQRNQDTAMNLIGHLMALAEEGFRGSYQTDKRQRTYRAKVLVIGAVPIYAYSRNFKDWMDSGFHRRFLWPQFRLADPDIIRNSIIRWSPISLRSHTAGFEIPNDSITYDVTETERRELAKLMKHGEGTASPLILLSKIYAVLKWRYRSMPDPGLIAMAVLTDFSEALQEIAVLEIGVIPQLAEHVNTLTTQQEGNDYANSKKNGHSRVYKTPIPKLQGRNGPESKSESKRKH